MDPLILSIISVILALCVLVENTIGLLKIVQGIKSVQESAKTIQEGIKLIQEGAKTIQEGIKFIQEGQIALQKSIAEDHRVMMEALERISIRLQEGRQSS